MGGLQLSLLHGRSGVMVQSPGGGDWSCSRGEGSVVEEVQIG